ncbi:MAG: MFS transporter, partial [Pseudomonadota bacterium]|nr:MFS transporter [Pseudomonadota bacterium]
MALSFILIVISRGASESFAVFLLPLSVDLAWDRGQVTSVYAIMMIAFALASPLAGILFDRFGPRVTYGFGLSCLVLGYGATGWLDSLWQFYLFLGVLGGVGAAAVG